MLKELNNLIKHKDLSTLYVEHGVVRRKDNTVEILNKDDRVNVPLEQISQIQLGPGTSITYSAVDLLAKHKVSVQWCKQEHKMFCYATENRKSTNLLKQCKLFSDESSRIVVASKMFEKRFGFEPGTSIESLRGLEGIRVKNAYKELADKYNVLWNGRNYVPGHFEKSDLPNQMLTLVNQYMYGVCNSVIVQMGLSPAIGFIHTGYMLSFVYDISDLYKIDIAFDMAFQAASFLTADNKSLLTKLFNERMSEEKMNVRIVKDIKDLLGL